MGADIPPSKMLRLVIEVPGLWADDLDESAAFLEGDAAEARLFVVTEEWMREEVVVTVCTLPGEKCMNDDFSMETFKARIVGAEAVLRDPEREGALRVPRGVGAVRQQPSSNVRRTHPRSTLLT